MSKKKRKMSNSRSRKRSVTSESVYLALDSQFDDLLSSGYTTLANNPEIISAVNKIAALIGSVSIHLMENTTNGDVRIKNELSRKIDIEPNTYMTRSSFISAVVRTLILEGDGNSVIYPSVKNGLIESLIPINPASVSFVPYNNYGYKVLINGVEYYHDEVIHIAINPKGDKPWKGTGYRKSLKSVADTLMQASVTKKGFMESKWKPSIIVKVDALTEEFASRDGRTKLMNKYLESNKAGEPWLIPAESFDVEQIKPLSLNDLAIKDSVELDKRTVASILDIPSFVLGIGSFNEKEWNYFVNTRLRTICIAIEQALTKALLLNPNWYFKFNHRSLLEYDIKTLSTVGCDLSVRGIITRNEVRNSLGYSPMDGLDELIILENFIPAGMIGEQKKLNNNGGGEDG